MTLLNIYRQVSGTHKFLAGYLLALPYAVTLAAILLALHTWDVVTLPGLAYSSAVFTGDLLACQLYLFVLTYHQSTLKTYWPLYLAIIPAASLGWTTPEGLMWSDPSFLAFITFMALVAVPVLLVMFEFLMECVYPILNRPVLQAAQKEIQETGLLGDPAIQSAYQDLENYLTCHPTTLRQRAGWIMQRMVPLAEVRDELLSDIAKFAPESVEFFTYVLEADLSDIQKVKAEWQRHRQVYCKLHGKT